MNLNCFKKPGGKYSLSVIVPVYNVEEEYLIECFESINNQTLKNIQVIIIDDGSTDSSGEIAKEYSKAHPNFEYHRIKNQGLGHARNYGVKFAKSDYIVFVDSDDVLESDIYEVALKQIKETNSEVAIFNVARFNSKKYWTSGLHKNVFDSLGKTAHITRDVSLMYDTTSWNKIISTKFWKKNKFKFPEGILYEDIPVTIPMHYLCNRVAVVDKIGYYWRERDNISQSITQRAADLRNFNDRMTVIGIVDEFFEKNVTEQELIDEKIRKCLQIDFLIFINLCNTVETERALVYLNTIRDYIRKNIPEKYIDELSVIHKQKYRFVLDNDLAGLINLLDNQTVDYYNAPITEKDGRFYIECSDDIFTIPDRDVTDELASSSVKTWINDISFSDSSISVDGHLYIPRLNIPDFNSQKIEAFLINDSTGQKTPIEVVPRVNTELTLSKGFYYNKLNKKECGYNYDGTGFTLILDLKKIDIKDENCGSNRLLIKYENRLVKGNCYLSFASKPVLTKIQEAAVLSDNSMLRLSTSLFGELVVNLKREDNFAENIVVDKKQIDITLNKPTQQLFLINCEGKKVNFTQISDTHFCLGVKSWPRDGEYLCFTKNGGVTERLLKPKKVINTKNLKNRIVVVRSNKTFYVEMSFMTSSSFVLNAEQEGSTVKLTTKNLGISKDLNDAYYAKMFVNDDISKSSTVLAECDCNNVNGVVNCEFTIDFSNDDITKNLYNSYRDIYIEYSCSNGNTCIQPLISSKFFSFELELNNLLVTLYRKSTSEVRIHSQYVWSKEQISLRKRQALIEKKYPEFCELPINPKLILFESMWGKKYSCNPRYLYEYIDKNYPEYECVWGLNDPRTPINGKAKRVKRNSLEYYKILATAKYFVNNVNFTSENRLKRPGQIEIQTMHGTPLKTLGLDVAADFATEQKKQDYINLCSNWDYLIVQGDFMVDKAFSCFNFSNKFLKTGYPRTDMLLENNTPEYKDSIKQKLSIPKDKKIIVYAPTWRVKNNFDLKMDIEKMKSELSDEYILLVKMHHLCAQKYNLEPDNDFVFDVTDYDSIEDLYLIADILITDYSSVMFDYGVLKKPMIFFTYDLKDYSDNLRGMYFKIEEEAPGPIVFTTEEVIDSIKNIDEVTNRFKQRIDAFNNKYINYECEKSSARIFETVFDYKNDLK